MTYLTFDLKAPALRINNRANHLKFFEKQLGFKTLFEENADAGLGDQTDKQEKLILVEWPGNRTRAVEGQKVLAQIGIQLAQPEEIRALLAAGASYRQLYQGQAGLAFETVSPQGDVFLLHAEADPTNLLPIERADFGPAPLESVKVSQFALSQVTLRTPDLAASQAFYALLFEQTPGLHFQVSDQIDFGTEHQPTWDIESLQLAVAPDVDLQVAAKKLEAAGHSFFLDKKSRLLIATDPSGVELWLQK